MDLIRLGDIKFGYFDRYDKGISSQPNYNWGVLKNSIEKEGWNPSRFGYVTISNDDYCINGHHRIVLLKEMYGDNFIIEFKRINSKYWLITLKNTILDIIKLNFRKKEWYK